MVYAFILKTATLALTLAAFASANVDPDTFTLTNPFGSNATVSLLGCQVTSFHLSGNYKANILFTSSKANTDRKQSERGGVNIAFPNAGVDEGLLPDDGIARTIKWTMAGYVNSTGGNVPSVATFTTESNEATLKLWPYAFKLVYKVNLYANQLETVLEVQNTFTQPFEFQAVLTNYIYADSVLDNNVRIHGLIGTEYYDRVARKFINETRDYFPFESWTDNVYINGSDMMYAEVRKGINDLERSVVLQHKGSISGTGGGKTNNNIVLYNPWIEGSTNLQNFGANEYLNMFALGAGCAIGTQSLAPGAKYTLQQSIMLYRS